MSGLRRVVRIAFGAVLCTLISAPTAFADPPAPGDYRSEVVGVEPPTDAFSARIVGGDSFLELSVAAGNVVAVAGYEGEPYLRFEADGTVLENRASPTYFINADRFGASAPEGIDADTPPDWVQVAGDGTFAWHDHRTHWMSPTPPAGAEPGDEIVRGVIPVTVDGERVEITVVSVWEPAPPPFAVAGGLVVGAVLLALLFTSRGRPMLLGVGTGLSVAALVIGLGEFRSLPPETGRSFLLWALPAIALAMVVVAAAAGRRTGWVVERGLIAIAGVQLSIWAFRRSGALVSSVLPTDLPWWLDRFVSATVIVGAPALAVAAAWPIVAAVIRPQRVEVTVP